jgi:hypothetical protein
VDVDAELESIRKEVRGGGADDGETDDAAEDAEPKSGVEDADAGDEGRRDGEDEGRRDDEA